MKYTLTLARTEATDGFFFCVPDFGAKNIEPELNLAIDYLEQCPNDDFMHKYALYLITGLSAGDFLEQAKDAVKEDNRRHTLFLEACLTTRKFRDAATIFYESDLKRRSGFSPLIFLPSKNLPDRDVHDRWIERFRKNMFEHRRMPSPGSVETGMLYAGNGDDDQGAVDIQSACDTIRNELAYQPNPGVHPGETYENARNALDKPDILLDTEKRHTSSLCPIALLQQWKLRVSVQSGKLAYTMEGIQTSYGKGLSLLRSRASCLMEVVERISSFASVASDSVSNLKGNKELVHGTYEDVRKHADCLDPNRMHLEVPYGNQPIYWIRGMTKNSEGNECSVYVPVQAVFLFCNLDEVSLFSGIGSTGLGSGNTMDEAKLSALHEVMERDASSVCLFDPDRCFSLTSEEPQVGPYLDELQRMGVHIQVQDMTTEFGVPCYKAFVLGPSGTIYSGWGCNLDAERAIVSAITEIPYPYGTPTGKGMTGIPVKRFEALPNYSGQSAAESVAIIEAVLGLRGIRPVYVDLTREDIDIPVVRAIVPGLEMVNDFDQFSRVGKRLFANYLRIWKKRRHDG